MDLTHLGAYLACGVLIIFYAWDRFSTPASNRSSTRQALYWWGCAGYIVSALAVFAVLSVLLQVGTGGPCCWVQRSTNDIATCTIHCDPGDDNAAFLCSGIETD